MELANLFELLFTKKFTTMKKILSALFIIILSSHITAQEYQKHEFSVGAFGGLMSLEHKLTVGKSSSSFSAGIGFGYTYFFKENMGLATGVDLTFYNQKIELDEFLGNHQAFDIDRQIDFDFRYTLKDYAENQNAFYLNIPIMLHYQFGTSKKVKFYAAGGFKVGLPINGKYKSESGDLKTAGYFPHNGDLIDDIPFRGFGEFDVKQNEDKLNYKVSFNLAFEGGAKWKLPKDMALYTGLFIDYGLNDIRKEVGGETKSVVQYNQLNPEDHIYNGLSASKTNTSDGQSSIISKVNTLSYGLKVRLAFGK